MTDYDFKPILDLSKMDVHDDVLVGAIVALCADCYEQVVPGKHGFHVRCLQGRCETLDRLVNRLDGWP